MENSLITIDGEKMTVDMHYGQTQAWDSDARFTFMIAGTQSGKTAFEPVWLDREMREKGPGDYLAVTATYDLFKLKFLPEMKWYFVTTFGWEYAASDRVIWKNEGNDKYRIILRSANVPGALESTTAKGALLDECGQDSFRLESWEAILRRLSLSGGRVLGGTTPYNLGWLKSQIYDRWLGGDKDYRVIQFKSTMNPNFPQSEYDRAKRTLPSWKFEMFYNGQFSRPAGLIYEDFTDEHIVEPFELSPHWPRYMGVDFGAVNTAKLWAAYDYTRNAFYIYRESLGGNKTTKQHVEDATAHERLDRCFGGARSEKQQRMDWGDAGLNVELPSVADVESGIDRVITALKERRLYVLSNCTGLIDELRTYSRVVDSIGEPTEKIKDKNEFHRIDALRYLIPSVEEQSSGVMSYRYA